MFKTVHGGLCILLYCKCKNKYKMYHKTVNKSILHKQESFSIQLKKKTHAILDFFIRISSKTSTLHPTINSTFLTICSQQHVSKWRQPRNELNCEQHYFKDCFVLLLFSSCFGAARGNDRLKDSVGVCFSLECPVCS